MAPPLGFQGYDSFKRPTLLKRTTLLKRSMFLDVLLPSSLRYVRLFVLT